MYDYKTDPVYQNASANMKNRYMIYCISVSGLGLEVKTFSEWLDS